MKNDPKSSYTLNIATYALRQLVISSLLRFENLLIRLNITLAWALAGPWGRPGVKKTP